MAARDIMPWNSSTGGTTVVRAAPMTASEAFERGEPVNVVNAGTLTEPPDDATQWIITDGEPSGRNNVGIAAEGPGTGNINYKTGVAYATNDSISYWPSGDGQLFITENFFAAGAASDVVPVQTDVGEPYQITYNTTGTIGWGVEQTAGVEGVDVVAVVVDVLDSLNRPIRESGAAGAKVVFEILAPTVGAA